MIRINNFRQGGGLDKTVLDSFELFLIPSSAGRVWASSPAYSFFAIHSQVFPELYHCEVLRCSPSGAGRSHAA